MYQFDIAAGTKADLYRDLLAALDALPAEATWVGAPVIVASGLYIVWREHVRRREETEQAIA